MTKNTDRLFNLEGRIALITGGSRGIGAIMARGFIERGAKVYISSRKADACENMARELGENCISLPADVSTIEGCEYLVSQFAKHEQKLDILVNNAGAAWGGEFTQFPEAGWDKVMDLNLKSPFFLSQKFFPFLETSGKSGTPAKIINIASVDGQRLSPWETYSYQASKAGLIHLTRRMAAYLVKHNIIANSIAPGAFASDMNRAARDHGDLVAKAIPAARIGNADDIIAASVFLAARSGDYIIGETISVDGGLVFASLGANIDAQ